MTFKELGCNIKAIPLFLKCGAWAPHYFVEVERYKTTVFASKNAFRESNDYLHTEDEETHLNATVERLTCKYCGKETKCWYDREPMRIKT